jgi:hypothetical protein
MTRAYLRNLTTVARVLATAVLVLAPAFAAITLVNLVAPYAVALLVGIIVLLLTLAAVDTYEERRREHRRTTTEQR